MCYCIGNISGCHINPAITFAMLIAKKISGKDALGYVVAQIIGAFIGIGILAVIVGHCNGLAVNTVDPYNEGYTLTQSLIIEVVMTFIFILVIFGATAKNASPGVAGMAIGLTLTLIHLVSIPVTNTSVNPARSLAPAVFDGGTGLTEVWIFIIAPLVGAALAAFVWKAITTEED